MDEFMEKVKERLNDPGSPVKTIKALTASIEMTQQGFYKMIREGKIKKGMLLAVCDSLAVTPDYFADVLPEAMLTSTFHKTANETIKRSNETSFNKYKKELYEIRQTYEAQLLVKDKQLAAKDGQIDQLLILLGKPEDATVEPLSDEEEVFYGNLVKYVKLVLGLDQVAVLAPKTPNFRQLVGGISLAYGANMARIK